MKCNKYKQLTEKMLESELSANEMELLKTHVRTCEICRHEYSTALNFKNLANNLKKTAPKLENKIKLIDNVMKELIDNEHDIKQERIATHWFIDSAFRKAIVSAAAVLILFFAVQQMHDAWLIKQLETKVAKKHIAIDYNEIKEESIFKLLKNNEKNKTRQLLPANKKWMILKRKFYLKRDGNELSGFRLSKSLLK